MKAILLQNKKKAFSLLELMLVLAIISTLAVGFLSFLPKKKQHIISDNINELNDLVQRTYIKSTIEKKLYQMRLFFKEGILKNIGIAPVKNLNQLSTESIQEQMQIKLKYPIELKSLKINNFDEMAKGRVKETWILFYPEGYTQEVQIAIADSENSIITNFYLHPFFCEFMYEE
jgi:prepilin-type N-terminal cleavage/methylation domain-containing protein